jgi:hypothetical protein
MRVLARREPVNRRDARLVVAPARAKSTPVVTTKGPVRVAVNRETAKRATRRRRRVLGLILLANAAVATVAVFAVIDWWYAAIPAGLLVAWLVACRLMVRRERPVRIKRTRPVSTPVEPAAVEPTPEEPPVTAESWEDDAPTGQTPAIADPSLWDPMPVTLPTYVGKPAAERRTVRTIDLDSTGVWTSGRTEADAQIAREADDAARTARAGRKDGDGRRAVGS